MNNVQFQMADFKISAKMGRKIGGICNRSSSTSGNSNQEREIETKDIEELQL